MPACTNQPRVWLHAHELMLAHRPQAAGNPVPTFEATGSCMGVESGKAIPVAPPAESHHRKTAPALHHVFPRHAIGTTEARHQTRYHGPRSKTPAPPCPRRRRCCRRHVRRNRRRRHRQPPLRVSWSPSRDSSCVSTRRPRDGGDVGRGRRSGGEGLDRPKCRGPGGAQRRRPGAKMAAMVDGRRFIHFIARPRFDK